MSERGAAERVEARAHHGADLTGVDFERVDRADRVRQQLLLDPRRATLRRVREERVAEVEVTALDAAALEDAFGERVPLQPQPLEHLLLGVAALGVRDGDPGNPRAERPRRRGALVLGGGYGGWTPVGYRVGHGRDSLAVGGA